MYIHNTTEDLVIAEVNALCDSMEIENKKESICTCSQCRLDAICYVLNRSTPHYVVSHRGASRININSDNQRKIDMTALAYEGIKRVGHNQRPYVDHKSAEEEVTMDTPVFHLPIIMGRVFSGLNFSPMTDVTVELLQNGKLAVMKDNNWQNPYKLIPGTGGTFTFLPKSKKAEKTDIRGSFEFSARVTAQDFAELNHVFSIPVVSELALPSLSLARTFKLPDLYLFPLGEEKGQLILSE